MFNQIKINIPYSAFGMSRLYSTGLMEQNKPMNFIQLLYDVISQFKIALCNVPIDMTDWTPLESNPDVLTKYIHKLGVSPEWSVVDIYGLDSEILQFIPKPVKTVILLYNCEKYGKKKSSDQETLPIPENLFYMRQYAENACGTIALVHGIANCNGVGIDQNSILKKFLDDCNNVTPEERGRRLQEDTAFMQVHQELAKEGQTELESGVHVVHHYVAFVNHNNVLYELDGSKLGPVNHGITSAETLLEDSAKVCQSVMEKDPRDLAFSVIAIAPTQL